MEIRIIKTQTQYRRALAEVARLAPADPRAESKDGVRLELIAKLLEEFEKSRFVFRKPAPGNSRKTNRPATKLK